MTHSSHVFVPVPALPVVCLVCGDGEGGLPVVVCAACDTLHHAECWEFLGRCSTYACEGGRPWKAIEAPRTLGEFRIDAAGVAHQRGRPVAGVHDEQSQLFGVHQEPVRNEEGRWTLDVRSSTEVFFERLSLGLLGFALIGTSSPAIAAFAAVGALACGVLYLLRHDRYEIDPVTLDIEFRSRNLWTESRFHVVAAAQVARVGLSYHLVEGTGEFSVVLETAGANRFYLSDRSQDHRKAAVLATAIATKIGAPLLLDGPLGLGLRCGDIHFAPRRLLGRRWLLPFEGLAPVRSRLRWLLAFVGLAWIVARGKFGWI